MAFDPSKDHAARAALQDLAEVASSSQLSALNEELDQQRIWQIQRIAYVTNEAARRVKLARGSRANVNTLNDISNTATSITQELRNYLSNRNVAHIDNAYNSIDQSLAIFSDQLPRGPIASESEAALESLRNQFQSVISQLTQERDELSSQLSELKEKTTSQDETISEAEVTISASYKKSTADYRALNNDTLLFLRSSNPITSHP